jgi:pre-mRNA-splicing factor CWC22
VQVNAPNIKELLPELFGENLLRGRGLFCQALMKAQLASPAFTPLYVALVAVVNTKFPGGSAGSSGQTLPGCLWCVLVVGC